jgi:hypothetical protein
MVKPLEGIAMSTDARMLAWCSAWALADGLVICPFCMRTQLLTLADEPFEHALSCKAVRQRDPHPWATLHDILDRERG